MRQLSMRPPSRLDPSKGAIVLSGSSVSPLAYRLKSCRQQKSPATPPPTMATSISAGGVRVLWYVDAGLSVAGMGLAARLYQPVRRRMIHGARCWCLVLVLVLGAGA